VDEGKWSCSVDALGSMQRAIKENNLNRVVIASCTPRTHEPLFKATVKEAGLNPYLLEFVSIREQVSWVHMLEPDRHTESEDLVKMGVAKAALLEEGRRSSFRGPGLHDHRRRRSRHECRAQCGGAGVQGDHRGKAAPSRRSPNKINTIAMSMARGCEEILRRPRRE